MAPDDHEQLAKEAQQWDSGELKPTDEGWEDAPEAVPQTTGTTAISIRLPNKMLAILKEFARRRDTGYQVLMKRWLDERITVEARKWLEVKTDNVNPTVMKERALFYLDRRLRELETQVPGQVGMAEAGMSYEQRREALESADAAESEAQLELGAMRWIRDKLVELK